MKLSKYNVFVKDKDKFYIYNTFSSTLIESPKEEWEGLKNNLLPNDQKEYIKSKIIIKDEKDEIAELQKTYFKQQRRGKTLIVTLALTLACNFACPYCYENRGGNTISLIKQNSFISFIESQLKTKKFENLFITWFGGEPLIALDVVTYLNEKIDKLCKKYKVNKIAFMSTNGYLISKENIDKIVSLNLSDCYITIDGGKATHNKTRILHNGEGTFDVILSNLKLLSKHNVHYSIRININKENQNNADMLLEELKENEVRYDRVFLGHIQSFTNSCKGCESNLTKKEFAQINFKFNDKTCQFIDLPCRRWTHCRAALKNNYVFDPELNIYQCENNLGRKNNSVGYIDENGQVVNKQTNLYVEWNPFSFKKCLECVCLPICQGGCVFMGLKNNKPQCRAEKYILDKMIKRYIKNTKTF